MSGPKKGKNMNKSWLAASVLSAIAMAIRTWDGHIGPLAEARASDLSSQSIAFFHVTWYFLSAFFLVSAVAFFGISRSHDSGCATAQANLLAVLFFAVAITVAINASVFGWFPAAVVATVVTTVIGALALAGRMKQATQD